MKKAESSVTNDKIYLLMNKPCGYVCSAVSDSHKTVYQLLTPELQNLVRNAKRGERLHTVGRLDCNTSGLLLLTTDGYYSHSLTAPEMNVQKTYRVHLKSPGKKQYIALARHGLILPAEKKFPELQSAPAEIRFTDETLFECEIKITEGKFHQVRRIFKALGNEVVKLERTAIGALTLPSWLAAGDYIEYHAPEFLSQKTPSL